MSGEWTERMALVAGATGYTGREVVRAWAAKGWPTIAHLRPDSANLAGWRVRFDKLGAQVDETPWLLEAMTQTMQRLRPAVIFALLGTTKARIKAAAAPQAADYQAVDYGLTALLIQAALSAGLAPRFVYLSAIGVGATARGAYYQARWRAETELRASGLPFIIARPAFITGTDREENRPLERIGASLLNGVADLANGLGFTSAKKLHSLTGPELALALVNLAVEPDAAGQVFETDELRRRAF